MKDVIKLILLGFLILLALLTLWYIKKPTTEGFQVAVDSSGATPQDAENPTLLPAQLYGDIPQAATISIFQNAELRGLTANPDSITISEGDPKTGAGAGPQLAITNIPPQPVPADDIEAVLNAEASSTVEGFKGGAVAALSNQAAAAAQATATQQAQQAAANKGIPTSAGGAATMAMGAAGVAIPVVPQGNSATLQGQLQNAAMDKLQEKAKEKAGDLAEKLKGKIVGKLKATKLGKAGEKAAAQAKKVVMKGVAKATQKLQGMFAKKVGAKVGTKVTEGIFKKMIAKAATKISIKAGAALAAGSALSSNPVTVAFGIMMNVIAAVGLSLGIALPLQFKDEGMCDPGWQRVSENWPSYLDMIPGLGDIMGAMAPYMCSINACEPGEQEDAGLCYPQCDAGYDGVGPMCWAKNVGVGIGVLKTCPPGWHDDGGLLCQQASGRVCGDDCTKGWDKCRRRTARNCTSWGALGETCVGGDCIGGCPESCSDVYADASKWIGKMNNDPRLVCPGDHPDMIDGLCYGKCPSLGGNPYQKTTKYPIWVKQRAFPNRDAAQKALDNERAKGNNANADTIKKLTTALGDAINKDYAAPIPTSVPYIRNPEGPRAPEEQNIPPLPQKQLPQFIPPVMVPLQYVAGKFTGGGLKPGTGTMIMVDNPNYNSQMADYNAKKAAFDKKYPQPSPTTLDMDIPFLSETVTIDPRKPLQHIPGMPYQCMGDRGIAYGRGVGKPKLKMKMAGPTPPPPPPPPAYMSSAYAEDPSTAFACDFSDATILQDICEFYYHAAATNPITNVDGTMSVSYITKIVSVIGSSEQSADIMTEITSSVFNPNTGQMISTTVVPNSDRRVYFAKIVSIKKFMVVGATNVNKTAPCVTASGAQVKVVNFVPVINRCNDVPITLDKCTMESSVNAMMAMYTKNLSSNVRIKSIDAVENTGPSVCTVRWTESGYDPATNIETTPVPKVGNFSYSQDKSNDACFYTLQSYAEGDAAKPIKALDKTIKYPEPLPPDNTLKGCDLGCKDPSIVAKLIKAFNTSAANPNRILEITKVTTPSELRCDVEANVFMKDTKQTQKQRIRFDLAKDPGGCVFSVANVGALGSGGFIQDNTPALGKSVVTKDTLGAVDTTAIQGVTNDSMKVTTSKGLVDSIYQTFFAAFGQSETLSTGCAVKCTDASVLDSIINTYNSANYPTTRTNVTKKTMIRILKAGTAGPNSCDILFEEKTEKYADLYATAPATVISQKTQRFVVKDTGGCNFVVDLSGTPVYELASPPPPATKPLPNLSIPDVVPDIVPDIVPDADASTDDAIAADDGTQEGFQTMPSVINPKTPALPKPYTGNQCILDCALRTQLDAMQQLYQTGATEGFKNGGWFSNFAEAFQDTLPTTMQTVKRSIKLGPNQCEYEVINSDNSTDYFTTTYTQDEGACTFTPSIVNKSTTPIIPGVPVANTTTIGYPLSGSV
jgi:hypothetical protein